jgi:hypothetical protein
MNFHIPPAADGGQANPSYFAAAQQAGASNFAGAHRRAFSTFSNEGAPSFPQNISSNMFSTDDMAMLGFDDGGDQGDPKRRRIARVCCWTPTPFRGRITDSFQGVRYVPEEENKVRWQDAGLLTLPELQDGMYLHPGREEEKSSKRVSDPNAPSLRVQ